jgi:hypothetical protein
VNNLVFAWPQKTGAIMGALWVKSSAVGTLKNGGYENALKLIKNPCFVKEKVPKSDDFETSWWR